VASKKKPYFTLPYQFQLADNALHEARHLLKARYYTSCIGQCYQVAFRCGAGLLFGIESSVHTEREVGIGFESAFVTTQRSPVEFREIYRRLAAMRNRSDFEHDYTGTLEEAQEALRLAERFYDEAQRLKSVIAA
jgi:uncharacterized protein (UPF0332 family)